MHPYWIQKIEEARRGSVIQFWSVIFLIVVLPVLLVLQRDGYIILGIACFVAAALRVYWTGRPEVMNAVAAKSNMPVSSHLEGSEPSSRDASSKWPTSAQPNSFPGPHQNLQGVPTTVDFHTSRISAHGVPTTVLQGNVVPDQPLGETMPVPTEQFVSGEIQPGEQQFAPPLETQSVSEHPNHRRPGRPVHFHDLAGH